MSEAQGGVRLQSGGDGSVVPESVDSGPESDGEMETEPVAMESMALAVDSGMSKKQSKK